MQSSRDWVSKFSWTITTVGSLLTWLQEWEAHCPRLAPPPSTVSVRISVGAGTCLLAASNARSSLRATQNVVPFPLTSPQSVRNSDPLPTFPLKVFTSPGRTAPSPASPHIVVPRLCFPSPFLWGLLQHPGGRQHSQPIYNPGLLKALLSISAAVGIQLYFIELGLLMSLFPHITKAACLLYYMDTCIITTECFYQHTECGPYQAIISD